jgi:L-iditol 2-dehydrogenase
MTKTMRAMFYVAPSKIAMRHVPIPSPSAGEVVIRVRAATTCGTDVKTYLRGHSKIATGQIFGHEMAGDIVSLGEGVQRFKPGMRVVPHNTAPCGSCYYCRHQQANLCENLTYNFGSYAEYARVPAGIVQQNMYEIPEHISYAEAAVIEPLSTVVHGQDLIKIELAESVAIFGAGPIGLMHLQLALKRGACQVIIVDHLPYRLEVARQLGATHLINFDQEEPVQVIKDLTMGRGADVTIECTGQKPGWMNALSSVRMGGRVLWFGGLAGGTSIEVDSQFVHYSEITIHGIYHSTPATVYKAYRYIVDGIVNTKALITQEFPLERLLDAFQAMQEGRIVKAAIIP